MLKSDTEKISEHFSLPLKIRMRIGALVPWPSTLRPTQKQNRGQPACSQIWDLLTSPSQHFHI